MARAWGAASAISASTNSSSCGRPARPASIRAWSRIAFSHGGPEAAHRLGIPVGYTAEAGLRAPGAQHAFGIVNVLERNGHTMQGTPAAAGRRPRRLPLVPPQGRSRSSASHGNRAVRRRPRYVRMSPRPDRETTAPGPQSCARRRPGSGAQDRPCSRPVRPPLDRPLCPQAFDRGRRRGQDAGAPGNAPMRMSGVGSMTRHVGGAERALRYSSAGGSSPCRKGPARISASVFVVMISSKCPLSARSKTGVNRDARAGCSSST